MYNILINVTLLYIYTRVKILPQAAVQMKMTDWNLRVNLDNTKPR